MEKTNARTVADVVSIVAHTLGFMPSSAVALLFTTGPKVTASLRVDADPTAPAARWARDVASVASKVDGADGTTLLSFEDEKAMTTAQYEALCEALAHARAPVLGSVLVTGGQIMDYEGDLTDAVPLTAAASSPVALALHYGETRPRRLAADVPAYTAPAGQAEAIEEHAAAALMLDARDPETLAVARGTLRDAIDGHRVSGTVSTDHAAWLAGTFLHKDMRDALAASLVTDVHEEEAIGRALLGKTMPDDWEYLRDGADMLHTALAHIPVPLRAETLSIIAAMRWLDGQGTEAHRYCELAQAAQPGHRLSGQLMRLVTRGNLPTTATTRH